jgi:hypothetical protein
MPSFPDSSVESDKEEYVEEGRFSPSSSSSESGDEEKGDYVALERIMKRLQNLSVENLKHVEHFIKRLDAKDTPKSTPHFVKELLPDLTQQSITPPKILSLGLSHVGFDIHRQASAREELNSKRFISFYGAPPQALAPLFRDVRDMFRQERPTCEDLLMTCNWLKCYDVMHVLEGRWGYCEDYIRPRIKRCQQMIFDDALFSAALFPRRKGTVRVCCRRVRIVKGWRCGVRCFLTLGFKYETTVAFDIVTKCITRMNFFDVTGRVIVAVGVFAGARRRDQIITLFIPAERAWVPCVSKFFLVT